MSAQEILKKLPLGRFLKTTRAPGALVGGQQRTAPGGRGNELFNREDFGLAQRMSIATKFSHGLIGIGDRLSEGGRPREALYAPAPRPPEAAVLVERIAKVMKQWLSEEKKAGTA